MRNDAISWMLILAIVALTLFPHHYHLHHVTDSGAHSLNGHVHASDVHAHTAVGAIEHGDDVHIIKSVADVPLKIQVARLSAFVALVALVFFLPFVARVTRLYPPSVVHRLPRLNHRNIPPLRAPPHA